MKTRPSPPQQGVARPNAALTMGQEIPTSNGSGVPTREPVLPVAKRTPPGKRLDPHAVEGDRSPVLSSSATVGATAPAAAAVTRA